MSKKAKYCKCLNTYTNKDCYEGNCKAPYYWSQGIGSITKEPENE